MIERGKRREWFFHHLKSIVFSLVLGVVGGTLCGAIILSLCGIAGRSQTTGTEYIGYWDWGIAMVGGMYGGFFGAIIGPVSYLLILRTTGFKRAIVPAGIGTIVIGLGGSLYSPLYGIPAAIAGFFMALLCVRLSLPVKSSSASAADAP